MSNEGTHFGSEILIKSENKEEALENLMKYIQENYSRHPDGFDYFKEAMSFVGVSVELNSDKDVTKISHLHEIRDIDEILECLSEFINSGSYVRIVYPGYNMLYEYRIVEDSVEQRKLDIDSSFENPNNYSVETILS